VTTANTLELLGSVNRCQVAELEKAGKQLDPSAYDSCAVFGQHVRNVQAAVIHTYQLISFAAIRETDPAKAMSLWEEMVRFCEDALNVLSGLREVYPQCGTHELYDLALDYRREAQDRYLSNREDSECVTTQIPAELFPKKN
jgi:hypothetical protein